MTGERDVWVSLLNMLLSDHRKSGQWKIMSDETFVIRFKDSKIQKNI